MHLLRRASQSAMVEPDSTFLRSSTYCSRWTEVCGELFLLTVMDWRLKMASGRFLRIVVFLCKGNSTFHDCTATLRLAQNADSGKTSVCTNFGVFIRFCRFSPFAEEGFTCLNHSMFSGKKKNIPSSLRPLLSSPVIRVIWIFVLPLICQLFSFSGLFSSMVFCKFLPHSGATISLKQWWIRWKKSVEVSCSASFQGWPLLVALTGRLPHIYAAIRLNWVGCMHSRFEGQSVGDLLWLRWAGWWSWKFDGQQTNQGGLPLSAKLAIWGFLPEKKKKAREVQIS